MSIYLGIPRTAKPIEIEGIFPPGFPYDFPHSLEIAVNGEMLGEFIIEKAGGFFLKIPLEEKFRAGSYLNLTIRSRKVYIPKKMNLNEDTRELSFMTRIIRTLTD